jgi:hypothetical protein
MLHLSSNDIETLEPFKRVFFLAILEAENVEQKKQIEKSMRGLKK